VQVTAVASPRNQQDPTAVLRHEGGGIVLGECQDGGQGNDQDDVGVAAFRFRDNLLQPGILFLQTTHLRQLRPTHPAEPLAPVVIRSVADTRATTGRLHVAAVRQLHVNLPQQLKYALV